MTDSHNHDMSIKDTNLTAVNLDAWNAKVQSYLDELQVTTETMDTILEQYRPERDTADPETINQSTARLGQAVIEMERMVAAREVLMTDADAPAAGASISEKLRSTNDITSHRLAQRCDALSRALANSHQRATSLFVCQFHLAQLSGEILHLLAGTPPSGTYGPAGASSDEEGKVNTTTGGGGIFNEAG
tara:strand:- start:52580 stop:53146 length:567 start_codon:yes stop_codon:yes gene_type:complete